MSKSALRYVLLLLVGISAAGCQSSGSMASLQSGADPFNAASATIGSPPQSTPMQAGLPAEAPVGYYGFCVRFPDQCPTDAKPAAPVEAAAVWPLLTRVNAQVNAEIAPELDANHYGIAEYWTIPTDGVGDCKSYTLMKRKVLHDVGIPFSDLRVAVVKLWDDELHAVLVVSTDRGDYVLDNLRSDVKPWTQTDYSWIEASSRTNSQWASLQNTSQEEAVASTTAATGSVISALSR